jgi:hypothetical protein
MDEKPDKPFERKLNNQVIESKGKNNKQKKIKRDKDRKAKQNMEMELFNREEH